MNANEKLLRVINAIALSGSNGNFVREFEASRQDMIDRSVYTYSVKGDHVVFGIDHEELFRLIFLFGKMAREFVLSGVKHDLRGSDADVVLEFTFQDRLLDQERKEYIVLSCTYNQSEPKLGYLSINGVTHVS